MGPANTDHYGSLPDKCMTDDVFQGGGSHREIWPCKLCYLFDTKIGLVFLKLANIVLVQF